MNTPTPTPRTDLLTAKHWGDGFAAKYLKPLMQAMERELTAVTEQRDGLRSGIDYASDQLTRVTEQRDKALQKIKNQAERIAYLEGATNHATGTPLSKAIEQRDRLAEALKRIANNNVQDEPHTCYAYEFGRMEGIAKIALAAVKGGADE